MNSAVAEGLSVTRRIEVDTARTIDFMGEENRVYATPELIRDIELTCRDLLLEHVDSGQDSVGTRVELDHIAATPLGMWVDVSVTVTDMDGRMVSFAVECRDQVEDVARGVHDRFIVGIEKTAARIAKKRAGIG